MCVLIFYYILSDRVFVIEGYKNGKKLLTIFMFLEKKEGRKIHENIREFKMGFFILYSEYVVSDLCTRTV